jgi:hypothetical protein
MKNSGILKDSRDVISIKLRGGRVTFIAISM